MNYVKIFIYCFLLSIVSCNNPLEDVYGLWSIKDISYKIYNDSIPYYGRAISFSNDGTMDLPSQNKAFENARYEILFKNSTEGSVKMKCDTDSVYNGIFKFNLYNTGGRKFMILSSSQLELIAEKQEIGPGISLSISFEKIHINKKNKPRSN